MTHSIVAEPSRALQPTAISIRAHGFAPGERVRLSSKLVDAAGVEWRAHGDFVADARGEIDVAGAPSEAGTFTGVEPAGLFWSMQPPSGTDRSFLTQATELGHKLGRPAGDPLEPLVYELRAEVNGEVRATTEVTLDRLVGDIEIIQVRDGRLRGVAFRQRDRGRSRGAIMSLTGSGGGVEMGYAPLLASSGYDVLSLAYFAYEDLSTTLASLPLEYFAEGFEWMRANLGATRMAVQGASRGGEASLVLAAYLPQHVSGAIAIVPMFATSAGWDPNGGVAGPSWTLGGVDIPYAESNSVTGVDEMRRLSEGKPDGYAATPEYRADLDRPEVREKAAIPVERANGPILLISGVDDQMWPCRWGSDLVVDRLRAKGFKHPFHHLALPETGHITPLPNQITTFAPTIYHSLADVLLACGGTPQGSAAASRRTWDAMLAHYKLVFSG